MHGPHHRGRAVRPDGGDLSLERRVLWLSRTLTARRDGHRRDHGARRGTRRLPPSTQALAPNHGRPGRTRSSDRPAWSGTSSSSAQTGQRWHPTWARSQWPLVQGCDPQLPVELRAEGDGNHRGHPRRLCARKLSGPERTRKGKETCSFPLPTYSEPGGLRQDPGRAAESPAEARTCGRWGRELRVLLSTYDSRGGVEPLNAPGQAR